MCTSTARIPGKGDVILLRKAGNVFFIGQERRNQQEAGFSPTHLSARVCVTDEGVRSECWAREGNVAEFDLGGVEDAQEEYKVGSHAEEEPDVDCEIDGGEDGERVRLLPRPRTPSRAERERHVVSHMPFRDWQGS